VTKPEVVRAKTVDAMNLCLGDGAEVIVPGCTILGAVLTQYFKEEMKTMPVPVIDPMVVGFKTTEMMADLRKQGYPTISRTGIWKKQPEEEFAALREWLSEHPSPEQYFRGAAKRATA
jgi:Asp/Glu/hydantoin racemase